MARIEVAKKPTKKVSKRNLYALICYHYPQYKLSEIETMPYRDIKLLLNTAVKIKAEDYYNLVQIAASPHSEKGKGVKRLSEHYRKLANG